MMPDLSRLDIRREKGTSNMGSLAAVTDENYAARFKVETAREAILSLRVHFAGGIGTAVLKVYVDSHRGEAYDMLLYTSSAIGTGTDLQWDVPEDELRGYYVDVGDEVVLTWTNPDDGNMEWAVELALCRCDQAAR
jgi:hypothetical protein